ncbi:hypothetical protein LNKW23_21370 [Paralimibaculum aggregatum]|uniref:PEP-CTERM sorting domain-containing protein n=1 Tax=Paralimibaculum aggregatum TaxID=3036245 RepID=A0ABQ6LI14_9RHOB|nr:VPLPA-CTERM sorting domain-containing protein [Limibaculum sp. NKW23]GMG82924.1 hypothetical protein LNKW23_21370 [Limibaculum sp. NKW23]
MRAVLAAMLGASLFGQGALAVVLDFEIDDDGIMPVAGQVVDGQGLFDEAFGVTIASTNPNNDPVVIFNSSCGPDFPGTPCTGGDSDLATGPSFGTEPQGNVLILQNVAASPGTTGGIYDDPNDDPDGGDIEFTFLDPAGVFFRYATLIDLDEDTAVTFTFFFADDPGTGIPVLAAETLVLGSETGDNSLRRFNFSSAPGIPGYDEVVRFDITFPNISGAVGSISYDRVPLPPALLMSLAAIGGLAWIGRRRRRQAA